MADSFQHLRIFPTKMNRETWAQSNAFIDKTYPFFIILSALVFIANSIRLAKTKK